MLLSLSILPIVLILVHGVSSIDVYKNKRVPRRHTVVTRTYNANHPPFVKNDDVMPVTVIYDEKEVIEVINKNLKKRDDIIQDEDEKMNVNANAGRKATNKTTRTADQLPSLDVPVAKVIEYEEDILFKPRTRSLNIKAPRTASNEKESDKLNITSSESEIKTQIRRSQRVRKVKVNKQQLGVYHNDMESALLKTENTKIKVTQKETPQTDLSSAHEKPLQIPKSQETFKRRKQLRDPVVPIIESESYVFAHSGDFHYSYEGGDGTKAFERGELKSSNGGAGSAVKGGFSYKDKDGNDYSLSYTADENGYRPVGAHLPTPPPIPPAIQRALDFLATKTTPEPITERIKIL